MDRVSGSILENAERITEQENNWTGLRQMRQTVVERNRGRNRFGLLKCDLLEKVES